MKTKSITQTTELPKYRVYPELSGDTPVYFPEAVINFYNKVDLYHNNITTVLPVLIDMYGNESAIFCFNLEYDNKLLIDENDVHTLIQTYAKYLVENSYVSTLNYWYSKEVNKLYIQTFSEADEDFLCETFLTIAYGEEENIDTICII